MGVVGPVSTGWPFLGRMFPLVELVHLLIDHMHRAVHRRRRRALQVRVERRINVQSLAVEIPLAQLLHQLVPHQVHKVRSLARVHALR